VLCLYLSLFILVLRVPTLVGSVSNWQILFVSKLLDVFSCLLDSLSVCLKDLYLVFWFLFILIMSNFYININMTYLKFNCLCFLLRVVFHYLLAFCVFMWNLCLVCYTACDWCTYVSSSVVKCVGLIWGCRSSIRFLLLLLWSLHVDVFFCILCICVVLVTGTWTVKPARK
jgi:hypothetical protein